MPVPRDSVQDPAAPLSPEEAILAEVILQMLRRPALRRYYAGKALARAQELTLKKATLEWLREIDPERKEAVKK